MKYLQLVADQDTTGPSQLLQLLRRVISGELGSHHMKQEPSHLLTHGIHKRSNGEGAGRKGAPSEGNLFQVPIRDLGDPAGPCWSDTKSFTGGLLLK